MNPTYDAPKLEADIQQRWEREQVYRCAADTSRPKYYACSMLPYPSGKLHMGHVRNYTITDVLARRKRMQGFNVLCPMGWDAFGLPAENAAMKNRTPPARWTYDNIAVMKSQMLSLGLALDWSREVTTCQPDYYRWNQWLFLQMLKAGICERRTQVVNWDPVDQTVLANEQVIDGRGWRSGALVEKREIPGYYLKITQYADELLSAVSNPHDPNFLAGWPERVRLMQENWIGRSEGVRFAFTHAVRDAEGQLVQNGRLYVFTTRADTIMGVTFCAVAPEHPLALVAAAREPKVAEFIRQCGKGGTTEAEQALQEKLGVATGLFVTHPLTGEQVPVWVGNYVLMSYGDGAVMGVPAHDERDFAFAKKYQLPIKQVIQRVFPSPSSDIPRYVDMQSAIEAEFDETQWKRWYDWSGALVVCVNSGKYNGMSYDEAVDAVAADLKAQNLGDKMVTWRLRDWGISRQRYWGTPIPIIHCAHCGVVPVPERDLPVVLPEHLIPDGSGNPLNHCEEFLHADCPQCGKAARRETDTMDTFVDSSWYFMRYCDPQDEAQMVAQGTQYWMPMDQYIGGIEHAILHLLYARFWTKVMRDLGLVRVHEPFTRLLTQGMVLNHIYARRSANGGMDYFWPQDVENVLDASGRITGARLKSDGSEVDYQGVGTMSKSKNNGVDPQDIIDRFGADTARLFIIFTAPPEQTLEWNDAALEGSHRFLKRVWAFAVRHQDALQRATAGDLSQAPLQAPALALRRELHRLLKQVSYDYERLQYNTVASGCMKMLNALEAFEPDNTNGSQTNGSQSAQRAGAPGDDAALCEGISLLLRCLHPVCPHVTTQLWRDLGFERAAGSLLDAPWPEVDEAALVQDEIELVLQINGKLRGKLTVGAQAEQSEIEAKALASAEFLQFAAGRNARRVVVVPGRLVNVVV